MMPRIRAETETGTEAEAGTETEFCLPKVRIVERRHKSLGKTMAKIKKMKAIKVNDITESVSKDLPKTLFRSIVITPRKTSKIFASFDNSTLCESKNYQGSRRIYKNKKNIFKQHKNQALEKIMKDIENVSELCKNNKGFQASPITRPISPWLYQGNSRRFSIFANK